MFTWLYIEVLLRNESLADHVWELWNAGLIGDELAAIAWRMLAMSAFSKTGRSNTDFSD